MHRPEEELLYIVDFGYNADSERKFTALLLSDWMRIRIKEIIRQDFQLKKFLIYKEANAI